MTKENPTTMSDELSSRDWWLGVAEMLGHGVDEGTRRIERAHLAIAEETFRVLRAIPAVSATSEQVKRTHDLIAHGAYASVSGAGRLLAVACRQLRPTDGGSHPGTASPPPADRPCDRPH